MYFFFDDEAKGEEMVEYSEQTFESIKHINEYGEEYWLARELSKVLDYKDFRNFELLIYKAMESCKNSGYEISDHFGEVTEMVRIGSKAQRELPSYMLSRCVRRSPSLAVQCPRTCRHRRRASSKSRASKRSW